MPTSQDTKQRLSELHLSIDDLRTLLFNPSKEPELPTSATLPARSSQDRRTLSPTTYESDSLSSRKRPRIATACNECRRLKIRCDRISSSAEECKRCSELKLRCESEKCKRGRVRGSKNKKKPSSGILRESSIADRDISYTSRIQNSSSPYAIASLTKPNAAGADLEDPIASGYTLNLPLESTRQSPEAEDRHMLDGPHPLSLLSTIGSRLRDSDLQNTSSQRGVNTALGIQDSSVKNPSLPEREIVPGWTHPQLEDAKQQKRTYFQYNLSAIKRDVAPTLDPITRGLIDLATAEVLLKGFFSWLQPQVGIMDPTLHTIPYLRAHSALLLTVVLATSAQTYHRKHSRELARVLYLHADRLFHISLSCDAKSPEIVLAFLVLYLWPKFPKRNIEDRSRILLTLAVNMGVELGFPRLPRDIEGDALSRRRHRDLIRTWSAVYIHDRSAFSGRPPLIKAHAGADEMRSWLYDMSLATPGDRMVSGYLELRAIENEARTRLGQVKQAYLANAVKQCALTQLEAWSDEWCSLEYHGEAPAFSNMMRFVSMHLALLILSKGVVGDTAEANQVKMRNLAQKSLEFFLDNMQAEANYICRTVCAMISWNAVVYQKLAGDVARDCVRQVALALAPFGDGRMDLWAPHFYGSFLLELSLDDDLTPIGINASAASKIIPSPSTLWVLQQTVASGVASEDRPIVQDRAAEMAQDRTQTESQLGWQSLPPSLQSLDLTKQADETAFPLELPIWDASTHLTNSLDSGTLNIDQILNSTSFGANGQDEWHSMANDWPWLFDTSSII